MTPVDRVQLPDAALSSSTKAEAISTQWVTAIAECESTVTLFEYDIQYSVFSSYEVMPELDIRNQA